MDSSPDSLSLRLRRESSGSRDSFYVRAQGNSEIVCGHKISNNYSLVAHTGIDSDIEEAIDTHDNVMAAAPTTAEHHEAPPSPVLPPIPSHLQHEP